MFIKVKLLSGEVLDSQTGFWTTVNTDHIVSVSKASGSGTTVAEDHQGGDWFCLIELSNNKELVCHASMYDPIIRMISARMAQ